MQKVSAIITKEDDWFVALCPELDIASQGRTQEEALSNLREAVGLYLEDEDASIPEVPPVITTFEVSYAKASNPHS